MGEVTIMHNEHTESTGNSASGICIGYSYMSTHVHMK